MIFYVIGNGFDLHYKLNTTYLSFKEHLMIDNYDVVDKVDNIFESYYYDTEHLTDIENWNNFEDMLSVFCCLDGDEIYEEAMSNAQTDDDRADYFDSPAWNVTFYTSYINTLKSEFENWINSIEPSITPDRYFEPKKEDFILQFNYTETIEKNYLIQESNILHIHGKIGGDFIVGHNNYQTPFLFNVIENEEFHDRSTKAMCEIDQILLNASKLYYKDSEAILEQHLSFFENICICEKVVFLGLSCGEQDRIYIEEVVKKNIMIDFYWHDETAKQNFKDISNNINPSLIVNYIRW